MKTKKRKINMVLIFIITIFFVSNLDAVNEVNSQTKEEITEIEVRTIEIDWKKNTETGESFVIEKYEQPDGTVIEFEHYWTPINYCTNLRINGYTIIKDKSTSYFCWQQQTEDGDVESSGYPVHLYAPDELGLEKGTGRTVKKQYEIFDRAKKFFDRIGGPRNRTEIQGVN
jgi:hypothetical protein